MTIEHIVALRTSTFSVENRRQSECFEIDRFSYFSRIIIFSSWNKCSLCLRLRKKDRNQRSQALNLMLQSGQHNEDVFLDREFKRRIIFFNGALFGLSNPLGYLCQLSMPYIKEQKSLMLFLHDFIIRPVLCSQSHRWDIAWSRDGDACKMKL